MNSEENASVTSVPMVCILVFCYLEHSSCVRVHSCCGHLSVCPSVIHVDCDKTK